MPEPSDLQTADRLHATSDEGSGDAPAPTSGDAYAELEDVDFLDDIDFSLEDVESRIAPLALAHH